MNTQSKRIQIQRYAHSRGLPLPTQQTLGAAGLDLYAAIKEPVILMPKERVLIPTGVAIALPPGYEAQIRPRSGLALKYGLTILNAPGTIDSDYRGEIKVLLINLGPEPVTIQRGDRIAQCIVSTVTQISWVEVGELPPTSRGKGGFGHTGYK